MIIACWSQKQAVLFSEKEKDAIVLKRDNKNCESYALQISNELHRHKYVFIIPEKEILSKLAALRIPYIICYPADEGRRYCDDHKGIPFVLKAGETIVDRQEDLKLIVDEEECQIEFELDAKVEERTRWMLSCTGMSVSEYCRRIILWLLDHPEELSWPYEVMNNKTVRLEKKDVNLKEIKPEEMQTTPPSAGKMEKYEEYFRKTGTFAHAIVVDEKNVVKDGYVTYLLAKRFHSIPEIVETKAEDSFYKVVQGFHVRFEDDAYVRCSEMEYVWIYNEKKPVVPGDILVVDTRYGDALMCVSEIFYLPGKVEFSPHKKVKCHIRGIYDRQKKK